jgi:carboxypeptidase Taq
MAGNETLRRAARELELLEGIGGLLHWDQQTQMPVRGGPLRGEQLGLLSRLAHERLTSTRFADALAEAEAVGGATEAERAGLRNLRKAYDRAVLVDPALVSRLAEAEATGFDAWLGARKNEDVAAFLPQLDELLGLLRAKAAQLDRTRAPYDVLVDIHDPGTSAASLRALFGRLVPEIHRLVEAVRGRPHPAGVEGTFPIERQMALCREVAAAIGYDFDRGRIDLAVHPFAVGLGPGDVRITTRYDASTLLPGLGGVIHEVGHALYEQGLPWDLAGTGVSEASSTGVHESQSRFWENTIGRSLPFYRWLLPKVRDAFPGVDVDAERLFGAANRIEPSLIRVEADEVTYNLHIAIRVEIEIALLHGELPLSELEGAWNDRYAELLGVRPPRPSQGVLQDVHWASGAFAYFPSYTLGNLYAAGLGAQLRADIPDLWDRVEAGDFAPILGWLRSRVHERGSIDRGEATIRRVVGDRDLVDDLLGHVWGRHGALYGVTR